LLLDILIANDLEADEFSLGLSSVEVDCIFVVKYFVLHAEFVVGEVDQVEDVDKLFDGHDELVFS
jgi:hypothetical protein